MYKIKLKYLGISIDIELCKHISVLSDDSGIGKTFIVNAIDNALKVKEFNSIDASKDGEDVSITVLKENASIEEVRKKVEDSVGLVIIDEADKIFAAHNEICDIIANKENTDFFLVMRGCYENLYISQNQYLNMQVDADTIIVKPFVSNVNRFAVI